MTDAENTPPIEIPAEQLDEDTLNAVIESFVLREGTDYGAEEVALATKIQQVRRQIEKGEVKIIFDVESESVTLLVNRQV
jgi:uncharacterized protein YheU (UPF0270 family)